MRVTYNFVWTVCHFVWIHFIWVKLCRKIVHELRSESDEAKKLQPHHSKGANNPGNDCFAVSISVSVCFCFATNTYTENYTSDQIAQASPLLWMTPELLSLLKARESLKAFKMRLLVFGEERNLRSPGRKISGYSLCVKSKRKYSEGEQIKCKQLTTITDNHSKTLLWVITSKSGEPR